MERVIALLDLDYFYAQAEILRNPEYRGKPVVVVMPTIREQSGAIATCNYEARALKIKSGMSLSLAKKLANKDTVFINADKKYYEELSGKVFEIVDFFCEKVEQVSIDEAYFDLSNPEGFEKAKETCLKIKQRIKSDLNLTCSVGLSTNKLLAKIACGVKKPDGFFAVPEKDSENFLLKQKVSELFGVGPKTEETFRGKGIHFVSDVRKFSRVELIQWLGEAKGAQLYDFAFLKDDRPVLPNRERQQISKIITLQQDSNNYDFVMQSIDLLSGIVYNEAQHLKKIFRTVSLLVVTERFDSITKSRTKSEPITSAEQLNSVAADLLHTYLNESFSKIRRVGIRVSSFELEVGFQKKLFEY